MDWSGGVVAGDLANNVTKDQNEYNIVDTEIWTNLAQPLQLEYVQDVTPALWPAYFATLMEFKMAWLIAPMVPRER